MKILLQLSIILDIFIYVCFFIGFALGIVGVEIGFYMIGFIFRYGLIIFIAGILLKLVVIISSFSRNKHTFSIALSSMRNLLIIGGLIAGIYYIGKIMSAVG